MWPAVNNRLGGSGVLQALKHASDVKVKWKVWELGEPAPASWYQGDSNDGDSSHKGYGKADGKVRAAEAAPYQGHVLSEGSKGKGARQGSAREMQCAASGAVPVQFGGFQNPASLPPLLPYVSAADAERYEGMQNAMRNLCHSLRQAERGLEASSLVATNAAAAFNAERNQIALSRERIQELFQI